MSLKVDDLNGFKKHRNSVSESLTTELVGREKETADLCEEIRRNNYLVVTGSSGVGKSRLAVEAIERFCLSEEGTTVLCTKSFSDYIGDLEEAIHERNKYVVFVDDANKFPEISKLIDYLKYKNARNIKAVFTVRDYLKECFDAENLEIQFYEVKPLKDSLIKEAVSRNTPIKNEEWLNQIAEIAKGNIRVAFLAANDALKDGKGFASLLSQKDVLSRFYKDEISEVDKSGELAATAGIIAFFGCIYLDQLFYIAPVLSKMGMSKQKFVENANLLVAKEIADDYRGVVRISDQCFADYMLNYALIEKKFIRIGDLLVIGFKYYKKQIIESVKTILHVYYGGDSLSYLKEEIFRACEGLSEDIAAKHEIEATFAQIIPAYAADDFVKSIRDYTEAKDIQWLIGVFSSLALTDYSEIAMGGAMRLLGKAKGKSEEVFKAISGMYSLNVHHIEARFKYLMGFIGFLRESKSSCARFAGLISSYLKFRIDFSEWGRGKELRYNCVLISDEIPGILPFRAACWDFLFEADRAKAIDATMEFAKYHHSEGCSKIIEGDLAAISRHLGSSQEDEMVRAAIFAKLDGEGKAHAFEARKTHRDFFNALFGIGLPDEGYEESEERYRDSVSAYCAANGNLVLRLFREGKDFLGRYFPSEERKFVSGLLPSIKSGESDWFPLLSGIDVNPGEVVKRFAELCGHVRLYELICAIKDGVARDQYLFFFYKSLSEAKPSEDFGFAGWLRSKTDKEATKSYQRSALELRGISERSGISYAELIRIFFRKRDYNPKIAANYLSPLLYKDGAFKELLELDPNLATSVYEFLISSGESDFGHKRLEELLSIRPGYVKVFAKKLVEGASGFEGTEEVILGEPFCALFLDACIKACLDKGQNHFISLGLRRLLADGIEKDPVSNWVERYIERNSKDDGKMKTLFRHLAEVPNARKSQSIIQYYRRGKCAEVLEIALTEKVLCYSDARLYYGSEIRSLEQLRKGLLELGRAEQARFIDELIENHKARIKSDEVERLMDYPNRKLLEELKERDCRTEVSLKEAFELYQSDESFRKIVSSGFVSYSDGSFVTEGDRPLKFSDAFSNKRILGIRIRPFDEDENQKYEKYLSSMRVIANEFEGKETATLDGCLAKLFEEKGWDYERFHTETLLSRDIFSKIKNGQKPRMAKKTLVQLLIGLRLSNPERNYLLGLNGTILSQYCEEDVLYVFLLESKVEIEVANELLRDLGKDVFSEESRMKNIL